MPCRCCKREGHNIRTCPVYNQAAANVASMVAKGATEEAAVAALAAACPPLAPLLYAGQCGRYLYGGLKAAQRRGETGKQWMMADFASTLMKS